MLWYNYAYLAKCLILYLGMLNHFHAIHLDEKLWVGDPLFVYLIRYFER